MKWLRALVALVADILAFSPIFSKISAGLLAAAALAWALMSGAVWWGPLLVLAVCLASVIGLAIIYRRRATKRIQRLESVIRSFTSLDSSADMVLAVGDHAEKICSNVHKTLLYDFLKACLPDWPMEDKKACLLELNGDTMRVVAEVGHDGFLRHRVSQYLSRERGVAAQAIRERRMVEVNDVRHPPPGVNYVRTSDPLQHFAVFAQAVPTWQARELQYLSALCLALKKPHRLSGWDKKRLDDFALKAGELCTRIRLVKGTCGYGWV